MLEKTTETTRLLESPLPGDAFVAVAPHYDALMQGVPYDHWVSYLRLLFEHRDITPGRILDLACGTGNVAELLAGEGYEVVGVDIAPGMIAAAQEKAQSKNLRIDYHVQDAAELNLPDPPFDVCVSLFDSLNYILKPERLAMAFQRVHAHLRPGGLFIFDLNTAFALENHFFDQDNLSSQDPLRYSWESTYFSNTRLCRVEMQFWLQQADGSEEKFEETHWQFAYRTDEILSMLDAAGFGWIETFQAYTLRIPAPTADRIFYVASRY